MRDYQIIMAEEINEIEDSVREKLKEGYTPKGGIVVDRETWDDSHGEVHQRVTFLQAMYRKTVG